MDKIFSDKTTKKTIRLKVVAMDTLIMVVISKLKTNKIDKINIRVTSSSNSRMAKKVTAMHTLQEIWSSS